MDARGLGVEALVPGAERSNMLELAEWSEAADKVYVF